MLELFENQFKKKNKWQFELIEQYSGGDFRDISGRGPVLKGP